MHVYEILKGSKWAKVQKKLLDYYQEEHNIPGYKKVYDLLLGMEPAPSSQYLLFLETELEDGEEEVDLYARLHNIDSRYSIECVPWKEVLAMQIYTDPHRYSCSEIVAHILFDITFWGFSEERIAYNISRMFGSEKQNSD